MSRPSWRRPVRATSVSTFRRNLGRLSLAGCSPAEPASVSPARGIVVRVEPLVHIGRKRRRKTKPGARSKNLGAGSKRARRPSRRTRGASIEPRTGSRSCTSRPGDCVPCPDIDLGRIRHRGCSAHNFGPPPAPNDRGPSAAKAFTRVRMEAGCSGSRAFARRE